MSGIYYDHDFIILYFKIIHICGRLMLVVCKVTFKESLCMVKTDGPLLMNWISYYGVNVLRSKLGGTTDIFVP